MTRDIWRRRRARTALGEGIVQTMQHQAAQQQQVGYPRIVGDHGGGLVPYGYPYPPVQGYIAGPYEYPYGVVGQPAPPGPPGGHIMVQPQHHPMIRSAPWRPMIAPGNPPTQEGHVPLPLNPETNNGVWGTAVTGGAATSATITFSARPQKPFKTARLTVFGVKTAGAANAHMVGQVYIGTDLQQGEVGVIDLETIGGGNTFDTWVSFKQAEPGVWIRVQASLLGSPTFTTPTTDSAQYIITAMGHYLH
jgi:hypothetical protein